MTSVFVAMQFLKKEKKTCIWTSAQSQFGSPPDNLQQSFSARGKLKTYFQKRKKNGNRIQKYIPRQRLCLKLIPTECVQALKKCLRNVTKTCQCPFSSCLQTYREEGGGNEAAFITHQIRKKKKCFLFRSQTGCQRTPSSQNRALTALRRSARPRPTTFVTMGYLPSSSRTEITGLSKDLLSVQVSSYLCASKWTSISLLGHPKSSDTHD